MRTNAPRAWSDEDVHLLRSRYARLGPHKLARALARSPGAIKWKARTLGVTYGDVPGWVSGNAVAETVGCCRTSVYRAARNARVARELRTRTRVTVLVPEAWADAYIKSVLKGRENEALMEHHYTLKKAAAVFGVHPSTLRKWLYGSDAAGAVGKACVTRVKVVTTTGRTNKRFLFSPWDVEREARVYREYRRTRSRHQP